MVNKTVIIGGGGASVEEGIALGLWDKLKDKEVWSCNYFYRTMPYLPSRQLWVDVSFYKNNIDEMQSLCQKKVKIVCKDHPYFYGIKDFITMHKTTREKNTQNIYTGRMGLCGMFALGVAIAEEYDNIILLGFDFGSTSITERHTHFYQDKIKVYSTGVNHPEIYRLPNNKVKDEVKDFEFYLTKCKGKIYNVSMNSNITCFEKITYETMFGLL